MSQNGQTHFKNLAANPLMHFGTCIKGLTAFFGKVLAWMSKFTVQLLKCTPSCFGKKSKVCYVDVHGWSVDITFFR